MIKNINEWTEVTKGLYRYVLAAECCYELIIVYWENKTDLMDAKAELYLVGNFHEHSTNKNYFSRELLASELLVSECLEVAYNDDKENNI